MSQLFTSGGQSIRASSSPPVFPMNIQGWFPLGLTGLISLQSKGLSRVFSNTTVQKHQFSVLSLFYGSTFISIHDYWKTCIALTRWTFTGKVISLLFNMLSRFVKTLLPRSKHLLISWLQSPSAVILEPNKTKSVTVSTVFPSICHEVMLELLPKGQGTVGVLTKVGGTLSPPPGPCLLWLQPFHQSGLRCSATHGLPLAWIHFSFSQLAKDAKPKQSIQEIVPQNATPPKNQEK